MALTDTACKNAKPTEKQYKLSDGRGLVLLVHPNGSKYWIGAYRFAGKQKSFNIGVYPGVKLLEARELWEEARKKLKDGVDPNVAKQIAKAHRLTAAQQTFEITAREWHDVKRNDWADNTASDNIHRLETDIFPEFGSAPISTITPQQVLKALRKIEERGALEVSSRTRGICSRVFNYAIACGHITMNPADSLKDVLKVPVKGHFASIEVEEFPEFIRTVVTSPDRMFLATRVAFWLMMRTFVRTKELIAAPWHEIDFDKEQWVIPGERMKKKRDHVVPLSRQVIALLREIHALTGRGYHVFPNQRRPGEHMSDNAVLKALERLGYKGRMTGHGFRSLAMGVLMQELGYSFEVADLQLAHVKKDKTDKAYDRAKFIAERTAMMQDWSDYIDKLVMEANAGRLQLAA